MGARLRLLLNKPFRLSDWGKRASRTHAGTQGRALKVTRLGWPLQVTSSGWPEEKGAVATRASSEGDEYKEARRRWMC